ncbi:fasciclin domain-containing protein [Chloroflexi bacterium TSY]|nr:fasciclin domain-containing protein [Chloroflexi bacterium TSY]
MQKENLRLHSRLEEKMLFLKYQRLLTMFLVASLLLASPAWLLESNKVSAQNQELRATIVTGTLTGGVFDKHWLAVVPSFPGAQVRIQVDWDRPNALTNGVGFWVLDPVGLNNVLGGRQARDVSLAAGDDVYQGGDNQMDASFNAFGETTYTVIPFNDSATDASYTMTVENATIVDDSGQVTDPTAPAVVPTSTEETSTGEESTSDSDETTAVQTSTDSAANTTTESTAVPVASVDSSTPSSTNASSDTTPSISVSTDPVEVREVELSGKLPVKDSVHYIGLEPNGRDVDIELVMAIDPQDQQEVLRRMNYFVIREQDLNLLGGSTRESDIAIAAGNRRVGFRENERVANFNASGEGAYVALVQNTSEIPASYTLSVKGGILIDDSGQTDNAQNLAVSVVQTSDGTDENQTTTTTTTTPAAAPAATTGTGRAGEPGGTYTIQSGDTVSLIARDVYGDVSLWRQLCAFNNLSDCNRIEVGDVLNLPTRAQIQAVGSGTTNSTSNASTTTSSTATNTTTSNTTATSGSSSSSSTATATDETGDSDLVDIVETARNSEDFNLLVAAIEAAGLVDALKGSGPFTLFAPTDQAFASLPTGALDALLDDPGGQLTSVLLYHVIPGKLESSRLSDGLNAQTVQGSPVQFGTSGNSVTIADVNVTIADIEASNGIIHVIDGVISPPSSSASSTTESSTNASSSSSESDSTGALDNVPVLTDASNLSSTSKDGNATVSYESEFTISDAAEFYEQEMERLGYTTETSVVTDQNASLTFTNSDGSISIKITPDTDSDSVIVTITTV